MRRRAFLRAGGAAGAVGLTSLTGCTMLAGSIDPSMEFMQATDELQMFKGGPATGDYPAMPMEMSMEGMSMTAVGVRMVAKPDDSNNYHFMPHVLWIEPGTTVAWMHADIPEISEPRTHSVTSFGGAGVLPRLLPEGAAHFDSGYIPGLHGEKPVSRGIDHRFNGRISRRLQEAGGVGRGPFMHTFERPGVYFYYCQNHHMFKMAGAVVVGPYYGEQGSAHDSVDAPNPQGWGPSMTIPMEQLHERIHDTDPIHGEELAHQVEEVRGMIHGGGEMMMGHGEGGGHDE